jgi:chromatin segregation and condensation protein Rec8/ScpA/Scc1 (kleisin family)
MNKVNVAKMINSLKDEDFKQELLDKIQTYEKYDGQRKIVDYYCKDENDDSRFMTAWFYISSNVLDEESNKSLKRHVIENFLHSKNITEKNKTNVNNMINGVKDEEFKNELNQRIAT